MPASTTAEPTNEDAMNRYDVNDIVRRHALMRAGPLKVAAYTVLDTETGKHGGMQFHITMGDTIIAVMGTETIKMLAQFADRVNATHADAA